MKKFLIITIMTLSLFACLPSSSDPDVPDIPTIDIPTIDIPTYTPPTYPTPKIDSASIKYEVLCENVSGIAIAYCDENGSIKSARSYSSPWTKDLGAVLNFYPFEIAIAAQDAESGIVTVKIFKNDTLSASKTSTAGGKVEVSLD